MGACTVNDSGNFRYMRPVGREHRRITPLKYPFVLSRLITVFLLCVSLIPFELVSAQSLRAASSGVEKLNPLLLAQIVGQASGEMHAVVVILKNQLDPKQASLQGPGNSPQERLIRALQAQAASSQKEIRKSLQAARLAGKAAQINYFWIVNAFSLQAAPGVIQALAARPDVQSIELEGIFQAPVAANTSGTAWDNLGVVGAPQLWARGFRGQGVVIASLDTGVDYSHPELLPQWRGGTNSWYDPSDPPGSHPVPADLPAACPTGSGHGTETMGVMVGSTVGVAPGAQWISAKIFADASCTASTTTILDAFQWLLDPDGNPATPDAPQVVNNSWGGMGCDAALVFQPALQALRAAGILPIFAAGNYGPGSSTGSYPGTYPEAFAVGASDNQDAIPSFSSRGPNTCVTTSSTFPALVAPGVDILTSGLGGAYVVVSGTSFAAPHAAGSLALLLSAFPQGLSLQQQEDALLSSAVDLGPLGPDNSSGSGRLDAMRGYQWLHPDARLGFAVILQSVDETAGTASIQVNRTGAIQSAVSVDVAVTGGTALVGTDYLPLIPARLDFAAWENQKSMQVTVFPDGHPSPNKTILLGLSNPQILDSIQVASIDLNASQLTLTIMNTDPWVVILPWIVR